MPSSGGVASKGSLTLVEVLGQKWVHRFGNAAKLLGFDADSVFNGGNMFALCGAYGSELRSGPGGADFSRGKMKRKAMVVGYVYRRLRRLRPNASEADLPVVTACSPPRVFSPPPHFFPAGFPFFQ